MIQMPRFDPSKVKAPIALLAAVVLVEGVVVVAALEGASGIDKPAWAASALVVLAIVAGLAIPATVVVVVKFRAELSGDRAYVELQNRQFEDFHADTVQVQAKGEGDEDPGGLEKQRTSRYVDNEGLFLTHAWRPSKKPNQLADVEIMVHQHGPGPLKSGDVEYVDYQLGPRFSPTPIRKTDPGSSFRLDVSAYGPMLCLAGVKLRGRQDPRYLYRYIDFPGLMDDSR
jgi:hypothetical protein